MSSLVSEVVSGYHHPAWCLSLNTSCPPVSAISLPIQFPSVSNFSVNANTSCHKCVSRSLVSAPLVALAPEKNAMVLKTAAKPQSSAISSRMAPSIMIQYLLPWIVPPSVPKPQLSCIWETRLFNPKTSLVIWKVMRQSLPEWLWEGEGWHQGRFVRMVRKQRKPLAWPRTIERKNDMANIVASFHVVSTV